MKFLCAVLYFVIFGSFCVPWRMTSGYAILSPQGLVFNCRWCTRHALHICVAICALIWDCTLRDPE